MTVQHASQEQIGLMKELMLRHELFTGHYDRLWKLLRLHEEDVRTPGDGSRMTADLANETIGWLNRQVAKLEVPS